MGSRYYESGIRRFISADDKDVLDVQEDLYDKNLYSYCDSNSISRVDVDGNFWEVVFAGGGSAAVGSGISLGALGSSIMAGLSAFAPIALAALGVAVVVVSVDIVYSKAKSKYKQKEKKKKQYLKRKKKEVKNQLQNASDITQEKEHLKMLSVQVKAK